MNKVIFEVTEDKLETGMRGYPVGYCITSSVDPVQGLSYVKRFVSAISHWEPEQVIYLLYHGKEGSAAQVAAFSEDLQRRALCSPELIRHIQTLPRESHPMKLFSIALLLASTFEGTGSYREDCLNVIAKAPQIAAVVINHHAGWGSTKPSQPQLGYMENFAQMLNVPKGNLEELTRVFKLFNVLHYDHGGGNLSVFVGKAVASSLEDMYGSLSAAMCALAGPKHGKANQDCLDFVKEIMQELGSSPSSERLEKYLKDKLTSGGLIFGFGHAVLRVEDPRATILYQVAQRFYPTNPLVIISQQLREVGSKVLKENPKIANPYPNVDAISGVLLTASGFPYAEYYTVLFGLSRIVGIARQIVYEREEAREGKGTPIIRPNYVYKERSE